MFRELFDEAPVGYHELDTEGRIRRVNRTELAMLDYTEEEMLGHTVCEFVVEREECRQTTLAKIAGKIPGGRAFERTFRRKDGSLLPVLIEDLVLRDAGGRVTGIRSTVLDITDRKRAEEDLKKTMEDLARSNKELEQFAYVASHDLQEPLRMVSSYVDLLARRYKGKLDADADEFIAYAVDGSRRMQRMIEDLLAFSRVGTRGKPLQPTDANVALDHALSNLQVAIEEARAVVTHDPLPTVMADETQLVQLFQNLIDNAVKFRGKDPPRCHVSAQDNGNAWVFSVRDNGIGIDPQYFDRIFVIFQHLHPARRYQGTGIGLSICKKIVERHGGRIWIESQKGKGSTFFFSIPKG